MKTSGLRKRPAAGISLLIFAIIMISGAGNLYAESMDYGYVKKSKAEERKKYVEKLVNDKKKADLAIQNTKLLINRSHDKSYLPELYIRLAELYVEESRLVWFLRKNKRGGSPSPFDQLESNNLKNQAIEIYLRIIDTFPDYDARDKVRFFLAHEYREQSKTGKMIEQYRAIIKNHKDSPYVPEAYLLLGDYFIAKKDLDTALRQYKAVLDYPGSSSIGIARYKLAWCYINQAKFKKALTLFEKAVTSIGSGKKIDVDTYKRVDIRTESLADMAFCYTESHKKSSPEEAIEYFKKYAWSRQVYILVLEKLANRYFIKKKWFNAAQVYRELGDLENDPEKLLEYAKNVFECVQAQGNYVNASRDMALIIKALKKEKYSIQVKDDEKEKNSADYELYARNLATSLHSAARKKRSVEDFKKAADSYHLYLDFFDQSPVKEKMEANYAEALFSSNQYLKAGKQYEALASNQGLQAKNKEEKLYGAIISYYHALKNRDKLNYYQTAFARAGLKEAGMEYAALFPSSPKVADVLFNVAWISYDSGKYKEAITEFSKFIKSYPNSKASKAAVHLVLDSYNLREDYEGLVKYGKGIIWNKNIENAGLKSEVAVIVKACESKILSSLTLAALDDWEKGKKGLEKFATQNSSKSMGEDALNALILSSREKKDWKTMISAGSDFVKSYPKSKNIENVLKLMIDSSLNIAQFRFMAKYLEEFAAMMPGNHDTRDFLYQAGNIRQGLRQRQMANADFQKALGYSLKIEKSDEMIVTMVNNSEAIGHKRKAINLLTQNMGKLSKLKRVWAYAKLAALLFESRRYKKAAVYRRKALKAFKPSLARDFPRIKDAMAKMVYLRVEGSQKRFMGIQLKGKLDNKVVSLKSKLLARVERGLKSVIDYQSPDWALAACFQANEINREFARFLRESPLPRIPKGQKAKYLSIIDQKAGLYTKKAENYLETGKTQAHKWEICDPGFAGYFNAPVDQKKPGNGFSHFSKTTSTVAIFRESMKDKTLMKLHGDLFKNPGDQDNLVSLAKAYCSMGDFRQAGLVVGKVLDDTKTLSPGKKAVLYNILGVSRLYMGEDSRARDAFKLALSDNASYFPALINLYALLQYYGHRDEAGQVSKNIPQGIMWEAKDKGYLVHPRARDFYYARNQLAKK